MFAEWNRKQFQLFHARIAFGHFQHALIAVVNLQKKKKEKKNVRANAFVYCQQKNSPIITILAHHHASNSIETTATPQANGSNAEASGRFSSIYDFPYCQRFHFAFRTLFLPADNFMFLSICLPGAPEMPFGWTSVMHCIHNFYFALELYYLQAALNQFYATDRR